MAKLTPEQSLARAKQAKARAEAQIRAAAAKIREADRRADTRRKVILGGALLARAGKDEKWANALRAVLNGLPEKDRAAFEGWTPPAPKPPEVVDL